MSQSPKSQGQSPKSQGQSPNAPALQPADHAAALVADEHFDDDEGLEAGTIASSSASITSSILRYRMENGRRYHAYKDGAYHMPNDETEIDRLNLQHYLFELTFGGKLFVCPAEPDKLERVLDVGTGTGVWAIDFGDGNPHSRVVGVDLSAIQPPFVPPNVEFFVDDVLDDWTYDYKFDLVYCRMLTGSIGDFSKLFKHAFDNMNPGGYIELVDIGFPLECDDDSLPKSTALYEWSALLKQACANVGRPVDAIEKHPDRLREAGFVNVKTEIYKWPINPWPKDPRFKEMGAWQFENMGENISGLSMAYFTRGLGWSAAQLEVFLVEVRKQMRDRRYHAYNPISVIYAQKPLDD